MKETILFLSIIVLLSCNSEQSKKRETKEKDIISLERKILETDSNLIKTDTIGNKGEISFLDFFESLMWNKEFQKSKVRFPFEHKGNTIESSEEWEYLPLYIQNSYIPTLSSDTLSLFENDVKTDKVDLFIVDFKEEISDKFKFQKVNNAWQLQSIENITFKALPDSQFIDFLIKFSNDSIFQINHISFPLSESYPDSDNDYETVSTIIKLEDWRFWKLTDDINQLMILSNIQTGNKYRNIFFRGVENGIWVKYTFEKFNDVWKLTQIDDHST